MTSSSLYRVIFLLKDVHFERTQTVTAVSLGYPETNGMALYELGKSAGKAVSGVPPKPCHDHKFCLVELKYSTFFFECFLPSVSLALCMPSCFLLLIVHLPLNADVSPTYSFPSHIRGEDASFVDPPSQIYREIFSQY